MKKKNSIIHGLYIVAFGHLREMARQLRVTLKAVAQDQGYSGKVLRRGTPGAFGWLGRILDLPSALLGIEEVQTLREMLDSVDSLDGIRSILPRLAMKYSMVSKVKSEIRGPSRVVTVKRRIKNKDLQKPENVKGGQLPVELSALFSRFIRKS